MCNSAPRRTRSDSSTWDQSHFQIPFFSFGPRNLRRQPRSNAANLTSKVVVASVLPPALCLGVLAVSLVRAGLHYSLLSLSALRLLALSCCRLQPYLPGPQSSRGCVQLSTRSMLFQTISFPQRRWQNTVPPQLEQEESVWYKTAETRKLQQLSS